LRAFVRLFSIFSGFKYVLSDFKQWAVAYYSSSKFKALLCLTHGNQCYCDNDSNKSKTTLQTSSETIVLVGNERARQEGKNLSVERKSEVKAAGNNNNRHYIQNNRASFWCSSVSFMRWHLGNQWEWEVLRVAYLVVHIIGRATLYHLQPISVVQNRTFKMLEWRLLKLITFIKRRKSANKRYLQSWSAVVHVILQSITVIDCI